jgi:hypothetical protein
MTQYKRPLALILLLTATAAGAAACAGKTIQYVLADPARYRDREVTISGNVVDSYSFGGQGAYHIEDRTGGLWVVSQNGVPRKGSKVKTTGTIREGINLGALSSIVKLPSGGVILVEREHRVH